MIEKALIDKACELHSGSERGYHGWSHPQSLLKLFDEVKNELRDPLAVFCAILFHDAIYEPREKNNEQKSAELAGELLSKAIPHESLDRTLQYILATEKHAISDDIPTDHVADLGIFLDMDLSILGASVDDFDAYEAGVRKEYHEIPEALFRQGRASILERFLARDYLYFSDWGRARFEQKARDNLRRSIAQLTS